MQLHTLLHAEEWAQETFGQARLGDRRRLRRLLPMAKRPAATLPKQMQGVWANLKGASRFFQDQAISFQALAEPVWQQTREQANCVNGPVFLVQDTTEIDYDSDPQISGLGPLSSQAHRGFFLQTV